MRAHPRRAEFAAVALITLAAAVLRLVHVGRVAPDPFYDAAVRSMGLSWHNFFFGAFEPSGSVSIDKPPIDLWLQVASVKLLGFSATTLKIPEALAGAASVPLLYACVRRLWGVAAGISALGLAVRLNTNHVVFGGGLDRDLLPSPAIGILGGFLMTVASRRARRADVPPTGEEPAEGE